MADTPFARIHLLEKVQITSGFQSYIRGRMFTKVKKSTADRP